MATVPLSTTTSAGFRLSTTLSTERDLGWKDFLAVALPPRSRQSHSLHESANRFFTPEQHGDAHRGRAAASSGLPMWKARLLCPSSMPRNQSPPKSSGPTSSTTPASRAASLIYPWFPSLEAFCQLCPPPFSALSKTVSSPPVSSSFACSALTPTDETSAAVSSMSRVAPELKGGTVLVASIGTKLHPLAEGLVQHFNERCSGLPGFQHVLLTDPPNGERLGGSRFSASGPPASAEVMQEKVPADCHSLFAILTSADAAAKDKALALREAVASSPGLSTTVALAILPMAFKGTKAYRQAHQAVEALRRHYGTVLVVDQGELLGRDELDLTLSAAAEMAEETAGRATEALLHLLRTQDQRLSRVDPPLNELAPVLCVGYGEGASVREATEQALDSPFLYSACQSRLEKAAAVCMLSDRTAPDLDDIVTRGEAKVVQSLVLRRLNLPQRAPGGRAVELLVAPAVHVLESEGGGSPQNRLHALSSAFSSTLLLFSSQPAVMGDLTQEAAGDSEVKWAREDTEEGDAALQRIPREERENIGLYTGPISTEPVVSLREVASLVQGRMMAEEVDTWLRRPGIDDRTAGRALSLLLEERGEGQAWESSGDLMSQLRPRDPAAGGILQQSSDWNDADDYGTLRPTQAGVQGSWMTWVPGKRRVSLDGDQGAVGPTAGGSDWSPSDESMGAGLSEEEQPGWWGNVRRTLRRPGSSPAQPSSPGEGGAALRQRIQRVLDLERPAVPTGSPERIQKNLSLVEIAYQGGVYHGTAHKGLPQGTGALSFANGAVYRGGWVAGKRHGKGKCRSTSGTEYSGGWQDDKRHGQGVVLFPNGDKFQGMWKDGQVLGWGTHTFSNGDAYSGWFRQNARDGPGLFVSNLNEVWFEVWDVGELLLKWRCRRDDF